LVVLRLSRERLGSTGELGRPELIGSVEKEEAVGRGETEAIAHAKLGEVGMLAFVRGVDKGALG
jgi:hypothetical protein